MFDFCDITRKEVLEYVREYGDINYIKWFLDHNSDRGNELMLVLKLFYCLNLSEIEDSIKRFNDSMNCMIESIVIDFQGFVGSLNHGGRTLTINLIDAFGFDDVENNDITYLDMANAAMDALYGGYEHSVMESYNNRGVITIHL